MQCKFKKNWNRTKKRKKKKKLFKVSNNIRIRFRRFTTKLQHKSFPRERHFLNLELFLLHWFFFYFFIFCFISLLDVCRAKWIHVTLRQSIFYWHIANTNLKKRVSKIFSYEKCSYLYYIHCEIKIEVVYIVMLNIIIIHYAELKKKKT